MKTFIKSILIFLSLLQVAYAQDVLQLSPKLFNPNNEILFGKTKGWYFHKGNDTAWAKKELEISGWERLRPIDLSSKMADQNGRVEGWFRVKIKFDTAFKNVPVGIRYSGWAAADIYLDGKLLQTHGNTGENGNPFEEFNASNSLPDYGVFQTGVEHTLAIHFVDFIAPFPPGNLKSEEGELSVFIRIIGPVYRERFLEHLNEWPIFSTVWNTVLAVLIALFWLLAFLNRHEKNLRLFALSARFVISCSIT